MRISNSYASKLNKRKWIGCYDWFTSKKVTVEDYSGSFAKPKTEEGYSEAITNWHPFPASSSPL